MDTEKTYCAGQLKVVLKKRVMRMSRWINGAKVINNATGEVVFDLTSSEWDLAYTKEHDGNLLLMIRKYPDDRNGYPMMIHTMDMSIRVGNKILTKVEVEKNLGAHV